MEISDILNSERTNIGNTGLSSIMKDKASENTFEELLQKSIALKEEKETSVVNNKSKVIDKKLMDVCFQMESIFVSRMLKEMRNTIPKEKLINGGFAEKIFKDMLYDEYALTLSKTSKLGIASMLYRDLS